MGVAPHALYSCLLSDLSKSVSEPALDRIKGGDWSWPGMTYREQAASNIVFTIFKKFEGRMNSVTKSKALEKFLIVNDRCKEWVMPECNQYGDDFLLGEFKQSLWKFWNRNGYPLVDHPYDILFRGSLGPGSSIGAPGGDFYSKLFSSKLSCTSPSLYFWYRRYIRNFPEWNAAELTRIAQYGEADIVEGNRLSFVPKNDDISRSICTEPVLNMFYQLGLSSILSSRLTDCFGICLEDQQFKNRELARKGSLDESFSTIDLSSASDSISMNMLRSFLPPDFFRLLESLRCKSSLLPNGKRQELAMISTMGNGFTFPLQTILFSCVVMSAFKVDGLAPIFPRGNSHGNFGVNGDDIVVPSRITLKVLRLLHLLGFDVNKDKTFVEGPFRESCGGDYFSGRNLRGVYIKKLSEPQDYYSAINQLNLFSTKTGISLPSTVQWLLKKVRYLPVPVWESDDSGIRIPFDVVKRSMKVDVDTQSTLYFAWTATPPPRITIKEWSLVVPKSFKPRMFNPPGLHLSFLQRSVNSHFIPLIPKKVYYKRKPRVAPNWDFPLRPDSMTIQFFYQDWFDWERWKSATYLNLFG